MVLEKAEEVENIHEELAAFRSKSNAEVENFLIRHAILYERSRKSRTFLIVESDEPEGPDLRILGFVSLAISITEFQQGVSKSLVKRLCGMFPSRTAPCFLIGQLAKNDRYSNRIRGGDLMHVAIGLLMDAQRLVGCRFVRVDCQDNPALRRFYSDSGFRFLQNDPRTGLCQMVRFLGLPKAIGDGA